MVNIRSKWEKSLILAAKWKSFHGFSPQSCRSESVCFTVEPENGIPSQPIPSPAFCRVRLAPWFCSSSQFRKLSLCRSLFVKLANRRGSSRSRYLMCHVCRMRSPEMLNLLKDSKDQLLKSLQSNRTWLRRNSRRERSTAPWSLWSRRSMIPHRWRSRWGSIIGLRTCPTFLKSVAIALAISEKWAISPVLPLHECILWVKSDVPLPLNLEPHKNGE